MRKKCKCQNVPDKTPLRKYQELAKPPEKLFTQTAGEKQTDGTRKYRLGLEGIDILALCSNGIIVTVGGDTLFTERCLATSFPSWSSQ